MALDDATSALLAQLAESGTPPLHTMTPEQARGLTAALGEMYPPGPEMARASDERLGSGDAAFTVRVLVPPGEVAGVVVYYHGGGWTIGALDEFDTLGRRLALRTRCAVLLVDYRLAPEHRYPAAADDAWTALRWADEQRVALAGRDVPLVVAGDSAGGNLSAVVARRARDEGGPPVALQVLVYPVVDADLETASYRDPANQLLLSRDVMIWFWDHYAPDPADRLRPDASPARVADLAGLPPALVVLPEHDVLRDEGAAYAERLRAAGVPVEVRELDGQMHGFFTMVDVLPGSGVAIDHVVERIAAAVGTTALPAEAAAAPGPAPAVGT